MTPPAMIVIGDVVSLRNRIAWFEGRPLFGKRILVTRPREQTGTLSTRLRDLGAEALECPAIEIHAVEETGAKQLQNRDLLARPPAREQLAGCDPLTSALATLPGRLGWIVFTSANGVEHAWRRLQRIGLDARALAGLKIAAVGPATADALTSHGLSADLIPEAYRSDAIVHALRKRCGRDLVGMPVLLLRGDLASTDLPAMLRDAEAMVEDVTAYHTVSAASLPDMILGALREGEVDAAVFTSASTVRNFVEALETARISVGDLSSSFACVSIGPRTSEAIRAAGFSVTCEAVEHTLDGVIDSICGVFQKV